MFSPEHLRRPAAAALLALAVAALGACGGSGGSSAPSTPLEVSGRVLDARGRSAPDTSVSLAEAATEGGQAVCPNGDCAGVRELQTGDGGRFAFDVSARAGTGAQLAVLISQAPRRGQLAGARTDASFVAPLDPLRLPALGPWAAGPVPGDGLALTWSPLPARALPAGRGHRTALVVGDRRGRTIWQADHARSGDRHDPRLAEDEPAMLRAQTDTSTRRGKQLVRLRYATAAVALPERGPRPLSRGRPCRALVGGQLVGPRITDCALTDGNLLAPAADLPDDGTGAPAQTVVVDLGRPVPLGLVAVRGCRGCRLVTSPDGIDFRSLTPLPGDRGDSSSAPRRGLATYAAVTARGRSARFVGLRQSLRTLGSAVEVSVFPDTDSKRTFLSDAALRAREQRRSAQLAVAESRAREAEKAGTGGDGLFVAVLVFALGLFVTAVLTGAARTRAAGAKDPTAALVPAASATVAGLGLLAASLGTLVFKAVVGSHATFLDLSDQVSSMSEIAVALAIGGAVLLAGAWALRPRPARG